MSNMSLRAELIRLCLPWFMRPRFPPDVHIGDVRRRMMRFAHLIPHPPRGTEVIAVEAGGVALALHERGVFTWPEWAAALEEIRAAKAAGDPDLARPITATGSPRWKSSLPAKTLPAGKR